MLGVAANFLAAYIPCRIWYAISGRNPHVHTLKNFLLFTVAFCSGNLVCGLILSAGLGLFFGEWYNLLMLEVVINNLGFSFAYGLPLFIVLTSEHKRDWSLYSPGTLTSILFRRRLPAGRGLRMSPRVSLIVVLADIAVMTLIMAGNAFRFYMKDNVFLLILTVIAAVLTLLLCILPVRKETDGQGRKASAGRV